MDSSNALHDEPLLSRLSNDSWTLILSLLPSTTIRKLLCTGNSLVRRCISHNCTSLNIPVRTGIDTKIPEWLISRLPALRSLSITPSEKYDILALSGDLIGSLPPTLTELKLELTNAFKLFTKDAKTGTTISPSDLASRFPNLRTLILDLGGAYSEESETETAYLMSLRNLPSLSSLSISYAAIRDTGMLYLPKTLTELTYECPFIPDSPWEPSFAHLKLLNSFTFYSAGGGQPSFVSQSLISSLPRTLTSLNLATLPLEGGDFYNTQHPNSLWSQIKSFVNLRTLFLKTVPLASIAVMKSLPGSLTSLTLVCFQMSIACTAHLPPSLVSFHFEIGSPLWDEEATDDGKLHVSKWPKTLTTWKHTLPLDLSRNLRLLPRGIKSLNLDGKPLHSGIPAEHFPSSLQDLVLHSPPDTLLRNLECRTSLTSLKMMLLSESAISALFGASEGRTTSEFLDLALEINRRTLSGIKNSNSWEEEEQWRQKKISEMIRIAWPTMPMLESLEIIFAEYAYDLSVLYALAIQHRLQKLKIGNVYLDASKGKTACQVLAFISSPIWSRYSPIKEFSVTLRASRNTSGADGIPTLGIENPFWISSLPRSLVKLIIPQVLIDSVYWSHLPPLLHTIRFAAIPKWIFLEDPDSGFKALKSLPKTIESLMIICESGNTKEMTLESMIDGTPTRIEEFELVGCQLKITDKPLGDDGKVNNVDLSRRVISRRPLWRSMRTTSWSMYFSPEEDE